MLNLTAFIPIRKGSERVHRKSLRPFGGTTLLDIKIEVLKKVQKIDRIVVATNCQESIQKAKKHGVDWILRDDYYCSSKITASEWAVHMADIIEANNILCASPTAPFIKESTYDNFIETFFINETPLHIKYFDSLIGTHYLYEHCWFKGKPLNYSIEESPPSQLLPPIQVINPALTLIKRDSIYKTKNMIGQNPKFYELGLIEGWDIDSLEEFQIAESIFNTGN